MARILTLAIAHRLLWDKSEVFGSTPNSYQEGAGA